MAKSLLAATVQSPTVTVKTTDSSASMQVDTANGVHLTTTGHQVLLDVPSNGLQLQFSAGGTVTLQNTNGTVQMLAGNTAFINGFHVEQVMVTLTNRASIASGSSNYNELSNSDVSALVTASRLNVGAASGGTTIRSIAIQHGSDPPDGRVLFIHNTSTTDTITLTNQDAAGTAKAKFFGPGDYVIPAGGGVIVMYDSSVASGSWLVFGK